MTFLFRFTLAAVAIVCVADIIPFPDMPPGLIVTTITQNTSDSNDNNNN